MSTNTSTSSPKIPVWLQWLIPLILLAGVIWLFLAYNPVSVGTAELPDVEDLIVQRVEVTETGFILHVLNGGPDPVTISQVLVDEAYWQFSITPGQTLGRLATAQVHLSYPWVETEPHEIVLVTSTGTTFPAEVELAIETPKPNGGLFAAYGLVGIYIGVIPVALGMLWYPALRRLGQRGLAFVLALTVGLLFYLLVDTLLEAFEIAEMLAGVYDGVLLTLGTALLTWLAIMAIGSRGTSLDRGTTTGRMFVALLIAIGIGFHNFGEGLVVGAAFALGEAALASSLVIGFILHNITEGIGIVAPVTKDRPTFRWFILLAAIAGLPAVLGAWIGGFAFSPLLAVIFLGIGIGAIWQVIFEVGMLMRRNAERESTALIDGSTTAGFLLGLALMYFTALFVAV
jgi:hypothetical protein